MGGGAAGGGGAKTLVGACDATLGPGAERQTKGERAARVRHAAAGSDARAAPENAQWRHPHRRG